MTIQFVHKGQKINAKVVSNFEAVTDAMIIFPESNLGELGWSIFFLKRDNQWTTEAYVKEKYPVTYSSLLSQLEFVK